jgi:pSer/pThr/pTyr-binding forkhead associated (FHA) protein
MNSKKDEMGTGTIIDSTIPHPRHNKGLIPAHVRILLRVEQGPDADSVFDLSKGGEYVIGRTGADIVLNDEKVSRKHAELDLYGPYAYVLRDLASSNGTVVNGKRIAQRVNLQHGDRIRMGETVLSLLLVEAPGDPGNPGSSAQEPHAAKKP